MEGYIQQALAFTKKYLPWVLAGLFIIGVLIIVLDNPIKKRYLKKINAPLYEEIDSLESANKELKDAIALDTTFVLVKRERDSLRALTDSLIVHLARLQQKQNELKKDIDDYGGTLGERLRIFANNLEATD